MSGRKSRNDVTFKNKRKAVPEDCRGEFAASIRGHLQSARTLSEYAEFSVVTYLLDLSLTALMECGVEPDPVVSAASIAPKIRDMAEAPKSLSVPLTLRKAKRSPVA